MCSLVRRCASKKIMSRPAEAWWLKDDCGYRGGVDAPRPLSKE